MRTANNLYAICLAGLVAFMGCSDKRLRDTLEDMAANSNPAPKVAVIQVSESVPVDEIIKGVPMGATAGLSPRGGPFLQVMINTSHVPNHPAYRIVIANCSYVDCRETNLFFEARNELFKVLGRGEVTLGGTFRYNTNPTAQFEVNYLETGGKRYMLNRHPHSIDASPLYGLPKQ